MASEQMTRENVTNERDLGVGKDRVPKMTTHFESLAEKARGPQDTTLGVGKEVGGGERREGVQGKEEEENAREGGEEGRHGPSLDEISKLRATAQQSSMDAIRAAEERYEKSKELGNSALQKARKSAGQVKDTAFQGIQTGTQYAAEKGGAMKDAAVEKGQQAKDFTAQKTMEAKDVIASKGQSAVQYASEKAKGAKDMTVDTTKSVGGYVGDKAEAAKDATVDSGKGAAGYAGKVAAEVKDQAVVAGWGATHYTLEKVAEATKAVADVTTGVAGYTGEKLATAKDVVVASEEKAAEYAARKKADAQKDLEAKKSSHEMGERGETFTREQKYQTREHVEGPSEKLYQARSEGEQQRSSSVFQAIGETLVEIGQTTKDILVGQYPIQVLEQKDCEAMDEEDDVPYRGGGEGI